MHVDAAFRQSGGFCDFADAQVFHISKKEHRALPFRQRSRRIPDSLNLFVDRRLLFGRKASIGPVSNLPAADELGFSPELKPAISRVISNQIEGNSYKPGMEAA
jgi:hypothetical protein